MKNMWVVIWRDIHGYIHDRYFDTFGSAALYYNSLIDSSEFHTLILFSSSGW